MLKIILYVVLTGVLSLLTACGGGGGGGGTAAETPNTGPVIFTVNKDGADFTDSYSTSTNFTQAATTAYFVSINAIYEWTGSKMGYSSGYITPTSGTLKSFTITKRQPSELAYSITNINYDISRTVPSVSSDVMPFAALVDAAESKVIGGSNNDITNFFSNTSEVDLGGGNDTLRLTQNYIDYQFSRVAGSTTSVNVTRSGHTTLVKNVESFQFANITKTMTEVLAPLP